MKSKPLGFPPALWLCVWYTMKILVGEPMCDINLVSPVTAERSPKYQFMLPPATQERSHFPVSLLHISPYLWISSAFLSAANLKSVDFILICFCSIPNELEHDPLHTLIRYLGVLSMNFLCSFYHHSSCFAWFLHVSLLTQKLLWVSLSRLSLGSPLHLWLSSVGSGSRSLWVPWRSTPKVFSVLTLHLYSRCPHSGLPSTPRVGDTVQVGINFFLLYIVSQSS